MVSGQLLVVSSEWGKWRLCRIGAPAGWLGESCSGPEQSKGGGVREVGGEGVYFGIDWGEGWVMVWGMSLRAFFVVLVLGLVMPAGAEDVAALIAADEVRVAAMKAADKASLEKVFSDELHYAHSSGVVDTKAVFVEALVSGKSKYVGIDYEERKFTFPAPGVALMTGRARVQAVSAKGPMDAVLSYLAVWRKEGGEWKFLAWQSCKMPVEGK